ncbi:hypothetical protein ACIO02_01245 [Streptomyces sp. NPDC087568]|uniref:hypothetical protein n=1 Tax=Streptomyces sp. NPDC087568 TaxID=3365799 RepID=UPI00380C86C4
MARRHASSEDFQIVGMNGDPTPGDPDLIQAVMQRYRDVGDAAEKALNVLKRDGTIAQGRGSAMDKLKEKIGDDLPNKLTKTMTSYHDAAQAYSDYIPRLQEAQDTFDRAVDQARAAAPQANQAPRELGAEPTDEEKAEARRVQDSIDSGKGGMSAARSLAEQAKAMRQSAQRECADVLDRAAREAIPERNIFQKIADFFRDFPFVQILLAALIAVVAVFFPVVGALLGGALFVFNQVVASQTGGIKAGDFVVGLLGIVPGGSLLKLGGRAVEAIAPAAVAAIKGSSVITKTTGTITKVTESLANNKAISGILDTSVGKAAAEAGGGFLKNSALETAAKAANHDEITAAGVFAGAAAGAVAGAVFKGGGAGGRFGDTTAPALGDSVGKRASDQVGNFVEEGATLGAKIGVGIAQGGDPNEVAAGEIANSAPTLGVGPVGKAGLGRVVDGVTAKIPIKGNVRPGTTPPIAPAGVPLPTSPTTPRPTGVNPADVPLPTSPTTGVNPADVPLPASPTTGVNPADVPLPASPTTPRPTGVNPADVPLPPSPTTPDGGQPGGRPPLPPLTIPDTPPARGADTSSSPDSSGFVTAPTSPDEPTGNGGQ